MVSPLPPGVRQALRAWRIAEADLRRHEPGSPEHEEAWAIAHESQWRYRWLLDRSKLRLSAISLSILDRLTELRAMTARRQSLGEESRAGRVMAGRMTQKAAEVAALADAEERVGQDIGPSDESVVDFETRVG
jgi:hypothetical protein